MTVHHDGADVFYSGAPGPGVPAYGDTGRVLVSDTRAAHVKWVTGSRGGQVDLVEHDDLSALGESVSYPQAALHAHLGESLEYADGEVAQERVAAVLTRMADTGDTDRFGLIAEEAVEWVAGRLRGLGSFRSHMAALDSSEGEDLVYAATRRILADALESMEDGDE